MGVRHALFPRSLTFGAQLPPVEWFVGCQFPDAALDLCTDDCSPFRLRSGACLRPSPPACRVRRLSLDLIRLPTDRFPNPDGSACRVGTFPSLDRGVGTVLLQLLAGVAVVCPG